jgi:DNA polymerase epsilon subunit 1
MPGPRNPIFGLTSGGRGKFRGRGGHAGGKDGNPLKREDDGTAAQERFEEIKVYEEIDERLGFWRFESGKAQGEEKEGWLVNMHQVRRKILRTWRLDQV